jgi:hypothetical protein
MMRPSVPCPPVPRSARRCLHLHAAAQAVGRAERDAAHDAVAELLLDLEGEAFSTSRLAALSSSTSAS